MTTDNKRDPNDVLREWDALGPMITREDLAAALRDTLAELALLQAAYENRCKRRTEMACKLATLRAQLDKAEAVVRAAGDLAQQWKCHSTDFGEAVHQDALFRALAAYDKESRDGHE